MAKVAGLYARVSTARQEEQETIDSQLAEVKAKIVEDGNELDDKNIFVDDGWTGTSLERPGLDAMRDAAVAGQFEVLYVYDRGRLSRIFAHQEYVLEELQNHNIDFVSLHDMKATNPEGHLMQAVQGIFHEYEKIKIAERFRRGKLYKARNGTLINGQALYGYHYVPKTATEPARYEIDEHESWVVKKIFEWVANDRLSVYALRNRLYEEGIRPRKGKASWSRGPLLRLLRNRAYVDGVIHYNKSEAVVAKNPIKKEKYRKVKRTSRRVRDKSEWIPMHITPILEDNGLFERVQAIMDYYKRYQPKNNKYDYLLSGLVWCECGQKRVGDGYTKGGNHYYRCVDRIKKSPLPPTCHSHGVNAIIADGMMWQNLEKYLSDNDYMKEQARMWLKAGMGMGNTNASELAKYQTQLSGIEAEKIRYMKAYGTGAIEEAQLRVLVTELEGKKKLVDTKIKSLETTPEVKEVDEALVDELCTEAMVVLHNQTQLEKKKIVQDIIDKVTFYDGGEVRVVGHIPQLVQKVGYGTERRNCRTTKCRQEHAI